MKSILLYLGLLLSYSAFANQSVSLAPINFQISTDQALTKFDQAVLHPEEVLKRFRPRGVRVSNLRVSQNEINFNATKTVLLVTKTVNVNGILDAYEDGRACSRGETGYRLRMHFAGSHYFVTDNVDDMRAIVCLREESNTKISGVIRSQIFKGDRYSQPLGPIAINLIKDQVSPLLSALTEEIQSKR